MALVVVVYGLFKRSVSVEDPKRFIRYPPPSRNTPQIFGGEESPDMVTRLTGTNKAAIFTVLCV